MRIIALAAMTVAFLGSVSAKFDFGKCYRDVEQESYDDYGITQAYDHFINYMDRGFFDLIDTIEGFGFKMPFDFRCESLAEVSPFKEISERQEEDDGIFLFEEEDYDLFFPDRPDAVLNFRKRGLEEAIPHEIIYICADTFSMPGLMDTARAFGRDISDAQISFAETFNQLFSAFYKLNLTFKIHGAIIFANSKWFDEYDLIDNKAYFDTDIPGYSFHELAFVDDDTDVYCPENAA